MQGIYSGHKVLKGLQILSVCECVRAFPVKKLNELLTLQKRSFSPLQRKRHQIV